MMMSERRPDPEAGLLLYLRTSSMQEIKAGIHEMRGLVQLRNQLAFHLADNNEVSKVFFLHKKIRQIKAVLFRVGTLLSDLTIFLFCLP